MQSLYNALRFHSANLHLSDKICLVIGLLFMSCVKRLQGINKGTSNNLAGEFCSSYHRIKSIKKKAYCLNSKTE